MTGRVYIVLALDTEGPVSTRPDLLSTWDAVDQFVGRLFTPEYRRQVRDSEGGGLVISWFVLTWTGFRTNPAGRDFGYHRIHDHYTARWGDAMRLWGDGLYWHYHQPAPSRVGTDWTADWSASQEYLNILNRLLIDRGYFPSVFRAGGAIQTNEMSNWLEQWIPVDYSSRASRDIDWNALDENGRRICDLNDWSRAPDDWAPYRPSPDDYQRPGAMRRVILRCPDLKNWIYSLTDDDVERAFERAEQGHDTVMATFDHDYRERSAVFAKAVMQRVARVSARHPRVRWEYANALRAAQRAVGWKSGAGPLFELRTAADGAACNVTADRPLFGPAPYVACRFDDTGDYAGPVLAGGGESWRLPIESPARPRTIGIAGSDRFGNVGVARYHWNGLRFEEKPWRSGKPVDLLDVVAGEV